MRELPDGGAAPPPRVRLLLIGALAPLACLPAAAALLAESPLSVGLAPGTTREAVEVLELAVAGAAVSAAVVLPLWVLRRCARWRAAPGLRPDQRRWIALASLAAALTELATLVSIAYAAWLIHGIGRLA